MAVVRSQSALVIIGTDHSISGKSVITSAGKSAIVVRASRVRRAIICLCGALVDIFAIKSVALISGFARAFIITRCVCTKCVGVALVFSFGALINIGTDGSVSVFVPVSEPARASEASLCIFADGGLGAVVLARLTLVDIGTRDAISFISPSAVGTRVTLAVKRTGQVCTDRIVVTVVQSLGAFINIYTRSSIPAESVFTGTLKASGHVCTVGVIVTVVRFQNTLVIVRAIESVSGKSGVASAFEGSLCICAFCVRVARVSQTLIYIFTSVSVAQESDITGAGIRSGLVGALCVCVTVIFPFALVNILAQLSVSVNVGESGHASAGVSLPSIRTYSIIVALVNIQTAFINWDN